VSLRVRLGLAAGLAVAIAVIAVAVSSYAGTRSDLRGQVDRQLQNIAGRFDGAPGGAGGPAPGREPFGGAPGTGGFSRHLQLDHRHRPLFGGAAGTVEQVRPEGTVQTPDRRSTIPADARIRTLARAGRGRYFTDTTVRGVSLRLLVTGAGSAGALVVALPLTSVNHTLSDQLILLVIIAAAGIALAALLGVLVARAALAPIARFTRQTEAIAASPERLGTDRLQVDGRDELARLARTFNETLDALEHSVAAQRNLVADASHELRTPIATIRANLQLMRDEEGLPPGEREALRRDVIEELDELTALVSDVVELARGSQPSATAGDVRLDEVVAAAVERTRRRAPGLTVSAELDPALVHGEGDRIARAVANLLDNAMKWSPAGGAIEVALRDGMLTVRDHGPGFEQADLPFVFDRFHRARAARAKPGSGLGLAIVRQAAEAHGGSVTAANAPGGGALLTISFGPAQALAAAELVVSP
jgi:two-component system, OmpR family, sensor histidine kinase MprB